MQTLLALQNTYADGFLNTSNQEAAKVLAAERKAQQLEQELQVTKDKSAQMMSRLNKMLDDKVFFLIWFLHIAICLCLKMFFLEI